MAQAQLCIVIILSLEGDAMATRRTKFLSTSTSKQQDEMDDYFFRGHKKKKAKPPKTTCAVTPSPYRQYISSSFHVECNLKTDLGARTSPVFHFTTAYVQEKRSLPSLSTVLGSVSSAIWWHSKSENRAAWNPCHLIICCKTIHTA